MFSLAVGREERCKQITLVSVGSACSVLATLGLPPSWHVYFPSLYLLGAWGVGAVGSGQPLRPEEEEAWTASGDEGPLLSIKRAMVRGVRG